MITPAPSVYADDGTDSTILVDAELLLSLGQQVQNLVSDISNSVSTIFTTLNALELGWAGQTADEAKDFFDKLDACMTVLYGKDGDTNSEQTSMLARVAGALTAAANNYLAAEDSIVDLFYFTGSVSDTAIWNEHNSTASGPPSATDITDPTFTSISETF